MEKLFVFLLLSPTLALAGLIPEQGSPVLKERQIIPISLSVSPTPASGAIGSTNSNGTQGGQIDYTNATDGIDPNASFLDDVPVNEGGYAPNSQTVPIDSSLSSKLRPRATTGNGAETVIFSNDTNHFNLTFGKCATRWGQVVGRWTFFNHSTYDHITFLDIYRDVCAHAGIPGLGGIQIGTDAYGSALNDALVINAQALQSESTALLENTINALAANATCSSTEPEYTHTELRKLLAVSNNYWTFLAAGTIIVGGINTGLYASAYPNNTAWQTAEAGVSASMLFLAGGLLGWVATWPSTQNADRQIAAGTTAAARSTTNTLSAAAGLVQSVSNNALSSLSGGSTQSLIQLAAQVNHEAGQEAVGGGVLADGSGGTGFAVAGSSATTCLTDIVLDAGITAVHDAIAENAGFAPFNVVQQNVGTQASGSCPGP